MFLSVATSALAGEQYVDSTGFAVSGYDVVGHCQLNDTDL
jgi:hypothetical protein